MISLKQCVAISTLALIPLTGSLLGSHAPGARSVTGPYTVIQKQDIKFCWTDTSKLNIQGQTGHTPMPRPANMPDCNTTGTDPAASPRPATPAPTPTR